MSESLADNYARAGYHKPLGFGRRPALLVIDFVEAYFDQASPLYAGVEAALASGLRLIATARAAGLPVIFTNVSYRNGPLDGGIFFRKVPALRVMVAGHAWGGWPVGLEPRDDELIISKQYPSAFFGTSLASTLVAAGVDTVILCGLSTSGCVRATCVDTMSHGFIPIVCADACGDRAPEPHAANLFDMSAKYADVLSEADVLAGMRNASCP